MAGGQGVLEPRAEQLSANSIPNFPDQMAAMFKSSVMSLSVAVLLASPALTQLEASLTRVHGGAPKFASGHAEATWNRNPGGADTLDVTVSYNGISSAVCGVHVHQGAAFGDCSTATPLSLDLISGNWTGEVTLGPGALSPGGTLAGEITVDVHTEAFPFGEIRGSLNLPRHTGLGGGWTKSLFILEVTGSSPFASNLSWDVQCPDCSQGLDDAAFTARLHSGDPALGAPAVLTLTPGALPHTWSGNAPVSLATAADYVAGELWIDVTDSGGGSYFSAPLEKGYLNGSTDELSKSLGGLQHFSLNATADNAGKLYLVLGSATGTSPGIPLAIGVLPLNTDPYFFLTLNSPGQTVANAIGILDSQGKRDDVFLKVPAGVVPGLISQLDHAFVVLDPVTGTIDLISNPVHLDFLP